MNRRDFLTMLGATLSAPAFAIEENTATPTPVDKDLKVLRSMGEEGYRCLHHQFVATYDLVSKSETAEDGSPLYCFRVVVKHLNTGKETKILSPQFCETDVHYPHIVLACINLIQEAVKITIEETVEPRLIGRTKIENGMLLENPEWVFVEAPEVIRDDSILQKH